MDDSTRARIHAICIKKGLYKNPSSKVVRMLVIDAIYAYMNGYVTRQFLAGLAEELLSLTKRPRHPLVMHKEFLGTMRSMVLIGILTPGEPAIRETHAKLMDFLAARKYANL